MNNATIFAADRTTHLKITVISLVASILAIAIVMTAHPAPTEGLRVAGDGLGPAVKAGQPYLTSRRDTATIR